ncbi:MAG: DUF3035 domain-containing protein [Proteobacteria bacterium]|nr:DUF3035 domain-containing protein [Pseudomonadota bacterium]
MHPTFRRGNSRLTLAVCGISLALFLGACERIKDQLGLSKTSPDEFSVVTRAPLTLPPDYRLRPPEPGAQRPQEISVQEQVKAALFNASTGQGSSIGPVATVGESALLARAGSSDQNSGIRAIINQDNAIFAEEGGSFVDALIFWRDPLQPDTVIDAAREDQRLQEAEATGEAPNLGETVIIERRERGILEGLF